MVLRVAATALLVTLLGAVPAAGKPRDRDRDGLPDRWERRHHVKKPRADQDRDGLTNRQEYRLRTNPRRADSDRDGLRDGDEVRFRWDPRRADSDGDGVRDGDENAGVLASVDGTRVVIRLARGGELAAEVEDPSVLECAAAEEVEEPPAEEDEPEPPEEAEAAQAEDEDAEEPVEEAAPECAARLQAGALVHEAEVLDGLLVSLRLVG